MYQPPVCGKDAASSATDNAPHNEISPPRTQTASISVGSGTRVAITAGVRKMPEPMVMPITRPIEGQSPRLRTSFLSAGTGGGACRAAAEGGACAEAGREGGTVIGGQ